MADSKLEGTHKWQNKVKISCWKKWKTKRSQFIIKDAMTVAMVVGIVSEMAAANEYNR